MRLLFVALDLLFIAFVVPSHAQSVETTTAGTAASAAGAAAAAGATASAADDDLDIYTPVRYEVGYAIILNCSTPDSPPGMAYTWTKNGTEIEQIEELKGRYELEKEGGTLRVKQRTNENDYGDYKCLVRGRTAGAWRVQGVPSARMVANANVVEGQKLKLTCRLVGKPYPKVQWLYTDTDTGNGSKVPVEARPGAERISLHKDEETGVPDGVLLVEGALRSDAGNYTCSPPGGHMYTTVVRVKGMYDALWPFLGICLEVFILCAIILVYEKRRTKPELEDSDTDNHDQKKS